MPGTAAGTRRLRQRTVASATCAGLACAAGLAFSLGMLAPRAEAQEMKEVTFIVVNNLFSTPAFVAAENGYWTKHGLNVKIKLTSSGRQVTQTYMVGSPGRGASRGLPGSARGWSMRVTRASILGR